MYNYIIFKSFKSIWNVISWGFLSKHLLIFAEDKNSVLWWKGKKNLCPLQRSLRLFSFIESFYYRLTNRICQMKESSHSSWTIGILRPPRWCCVFATVTNKRFFSPPAVLFHSLCCSACRSSNTPNTSINYMLAWRFRNSELWKPGQQKSGLFSSMLNGTQVVFCFFVSPWLSES